MISDANAAELSGKVAVVTGAAAGLGRAEAIGLARMGATVVVNDIATALDASDVVDEVAATTGGKAVAVAGDISQRATADELVATADGLGGLDIVVNNAGITRDRMLFNMTDEDWDQVIAVHLRGHFLLTRNAATYWRAKAKQASDGVVYGRLVNTSSEAGLVGPVGQANYAAAKAGITALTLSAARALGRYGVCANVICPRARTAMTAEVFGDAPDDGLVDPLSPEHVVTLVQFLASPAAADVNGQLFIVYGPQVMLVSAPCLEHRFTADGSAWEPAQLSATLRDYFAGRDREVGFSATGLMVQ
ncbi:3-oxoacyl-ACP reductase [Mycobacterium shinjukuense]|uniref:3-oxoacyl-ACP reductase n=1 Tax=Mycobacterium shinjukuense TaxID=398694 RepID=A0A7I7MV07_9MYCO|nr:3-oxoacyl-ACP reductase [Mycobacterium shinjukuense]MCV6987613.1 3-oxoacyl-ACP reductase [Mycobacterium shinjukuense]ORB68326.1 3-oxoacyl-ACP reductase [Mycobacterium shinjukuense]BBX76031.1 3-oxoacyl-ACP reductase [Mycobacterium shinjukuense]